VPKFIGDFEGVCDVLPAADVQGCHDFFKNEHQLVVQMGQEAVQWLAGEIPFAHCKVGPQGKSLVKSTKDSIECDACDDAISMLNFLLGSGLVDGSLKHLLDELCAKLPEPYADGCVSTVDGGMDQIIKYITDMTDHICPDALGCKAKSMKTMRRQRPTRSASNAVCDAMQELYNAVPKFIGDFEGVCDVLPAADVQGCHDFFKNEHQLVVQMGQEAVQWLAGEIPFAHCKVGPQSL